MSYAELSNHGGLSLFYSLYPHDLGKSQKNNTHPVHKHDDNSSCFPPTHIEHLPETRRMESARAPRGFRICVGFQARRIPREEIGPGAIRHAPPTRCPAFPARSRNPLGIFSRGIRRAERVRVGFRGRGARLFHPTFTEGLAIGYLEAVLSAHRAFPEKEGRTCSGRYLWANWSHAVNCFDPTLDRCDLLRYYSIAPPVTL